MSNVVSEGREFLVETRLLESEGLHNLRADAGNIARRVGKVVAELLESFSSVKLHLPMRL